MNRPLIAVAALNRKSIGQKVLLGQSILKALADHATVFPNPNPSVAKIDEATKELEAAAEAAATGSMVGKQRLKQAERAFDEVINTYKTYINLIAQGNGVIIEQSGLDVSRTVQKAAPLTAPLKPQLTGTNSGELKASVNTLPGAQAYVWMTYTGTTPPATDAEWQFGTATTTSRFVFDRLISGQRVWMRCAAVGTRGLGPWSEPVSRLVL